MLSCVIAFLATFFSGVARAEIDTARFPLLLPEPGKIQRVAGSEISSDVIKILSRHKEWHSVAGLYIPGYSPLMPANRKWTLRRTGSSLQFVESTALWAKQDCESEKYLGWEKATINLDREINPSDFLTGGPAHCSSNFPAKLRFRSLGNDRFVLLPESAGIAVLFFPAQPSFPREPRALLDTTHIFTAPFGPSSLDEVTGLPLSKIDYFHHSLSSPMEVVMDSSYPDRFVPALKKALDVWNTELGADFFRVSLTKNKLDVFDCLSSRKLCIFWNGSPSISFLGATGITQSTFDPQSGEIIGGYIGIDGSQKETLQSPPSTSEVARFTADQASADDIAKLFLQRDHLAEVWHPRPEWQVSFVISHELGHFNGLSHNFYGNNFGDENFRSKTVMDYPAFSAIGSSSFMPGPFDSAAINIIYKNAAPGDSYRYCGDRDSNQEGVSANPSCNKFDFGRPEAWLIRLSQLADGGVRAKHPRFEGILLDYLSPFLGTVKDGVSFDQQTAVRRFLCREYGDDGWVIDYLSSDGKPGLRCN